MLGWGIDKVNEMIETARVIANHCNISLMVRLLQTSILESKHLNHSPHKESCTKVFEVYQRYAARITSKQNISNDQELIQ